MDKDQQLRSPWAHDVNPDDLESFEDYCLWLEGMLSGPCGIWEEEDGATFVINQRALVERVKGMTIIINPNEHPPPHFHVKYQGNNVSFAIADCTILAGKMDNRELRIVCHWHKHAKEKLIEKWNETRPTNCPVGYYNENAQQGNARDRASRGP